MSDDSQIISSSSGITFIGPDAVMLYQAVSLKTAIKLYAKCGMRMTRTATPAVMLAAATRITGKKYKRGQYTEAVADLDAWIITMRAALPVTTT
jgi:hypothetical protein